MFLPNASSTLVCIAVIVAVASAAAVHNSPRKANRPHQPPTFLTNEEFQKWSGRIVGGETAYVGQFPYMASLRDSVFTDFHFCGGVILDRLWILTAGHCVSWDEPEDMVVVVGAHRISEGGRVHNISEIIVHEGFDFSTQFNDIALLRLEEPIEYDDNVQPISFGNEEFVGAGVLAVASGWGNLYLGGPVPDELQYLNMVTLNTDDCRSRHPVHAEKVYDHSLCVYAGGRERGMCFGDSGSPLTNSNGLLLGLVSWGEPCGLGYPDVFVRISSFAPWIKHHLSVVEVVPF